MKRIMEEAKDYWKAMLRAVIDEAVCQGLLPYLDNAMVAIEITTPHAKNIANVWNISN